MKYFCLVAVSLLALPAVSLAQRTYTSVCTDLKKNTDPKKEVVLTICNQERGMMALPPLRLYLRVYADGAAEYEENAREDRAGNDMLIMHRFKLAAGQLAELVRAGSLPDLQTAAAAYPIYHPGDDSTLESTVTFGKKTILLRNYSAWDKDDHKHYPSAVVLLMHLCEEFRYGKPVPGLAPKEAEILEYAGELTQGKYYRATANFSSDHGMTLVPAAKIPYRYTASYGWTNVNDFPQLTPGKDAPSRRVVFRVLGKEVTNSLKLITFSLEIIRVE